MGYIENLALLQRIEKQQLRKCFWGALAGAALSVGSALIGGNASRKAQKRAERIRQQEKARENAWYNRARHESYLDTAAGRNTIRKAEEWAWKNNKRAEGQAAVTGGTTAAAAVQKEAGNNMVANAVGNVAANDTARKDKADAQHNTASRGYANAEAAAAERQGADRAQVASQVGNAMASVATAALDGMPSKQAQAPASMPKPDGYDRLQTDMAYQAKAVLSKVGDAPTVKLANWQNWSGKQPPKQKPTYMWPAPPL